MASQDPTNGGGIMLRALGAVVSRFDSSGWFSNLTGLGTSRDKRTSVQLNWDPLPAEELERLSRGSPMHKRVVNMLPDECLRTGFEVRIPGETNLAQEVNSQLAELEAEDHLWENFKLARLYGGGLTTIGINGGNDDPRTPINPDNILSVDFLNTYSSREAWALDYYAQMNRANYGRVATYQLSPIFGGWAGPGWDRIHGSRTIQLDGVHVERHVRHANFGWGDSVLQAVHDTIRDWSASYAGVAHLLADAGQGVYTMPELTKLIVANRMDVVQQKLAIQDMARSMIRGILVGDGEKFERVSTPFTGIPDALQRLDFMLSAVIGHPATVILGQAPAGLNATGAADLELFRAAAQSEQRRRLHPQASALVKCLLLAKRGPTGGVEPDKWALVWRPLAVPSDKERAETRKTVAETDAIYVRDIGGLSPEEVVRSRYGGEEYSPETTIDPTLRRELPTGRAEEEDQGTVDPQPEDGLETDVPAPTSGGRGATTPPVASQALNGAQLEGLLAIVGQVARRELPRESGIATMLTAFPGLISEAQAERIMGEVGKAFFIDPAPPGE